jgi:hypothetical protein
MAAEDRDRSPREYEDRAVVHELRRERARRTAVEAVEDADAQRVVDLSDDEPQIVFPDPPARSSYYVEIPYRDPQKAEPAATGEREEEASGDAGPPLAEPPKAEPPKAEPQMAEPQMAEPALPEPRPGRFRSLRDWWRQESLSRAAEKRALATAEAILRAQAVQQATRPVDRTPSEADRSQSVQAVLSLTEERFQSLGLRSDRLQDELTGISKTLEDLRALVTGGASPKRIAGATTEALGSLEERFDSLLIALSEEFHRRTEETERRISEQLRAQSSETASLVEGAVERIRAAIPEALLEIVPPELGKMREQQRQDLDTILLTSSKQIELLRGFTREELAKLREVVPEEIAKLERLVPEEIAKLERLVPEAIEGLEKLIPQQVGLLRAENIAMADDVRAGVIAAIEELGRSTEERIESHLEKIRIVTSEELLRFRQDANEEAAARAEHAVVEADRFREATATELREMREHTERELEHLGVTVSEEIERIRTTTDEALGAVAGAVPDQLERIRETTAAELERFRTTAGEQLDRVRWSIPEQLERSRGVTVEELERIREDIGRISQTLHDAIGEVPAFSPVREEATSGGLPPEPEVIEAMDRRLDEVLVAVNRNTDRLADAFARTLRELERELTRDRRAV